MRVDALLSGDHLRHDAEGTVGELLNAPELLVGTGIGGNGDYLAVGSSSQCTLGALDHNLEIGVAKVGTLTLYRAHGPTLVGTEHIVADTSGDVTLGPCTLDLIQCLVSHGLWGSSILLWTTTESAEATCTGYVHANEIDSQLEGIATTL